MMCTSAEPGCGRGALVGTLVGAGVCVIMMGSMAAGAGRCRKFALKSAPHSPC